MMFVSSQRICGDAPSKQMRVLLPCVGYRRISPTIPRALTGPCGKVPLHLRKPGLTGHTVATSTYILRQATQEDKAITQGRNLK